MSSYRTSTKLAVIYPRYRFGLRPGENRPTGLGRASRILHFLFDATHRFTSFASHPNSTACVQPPKICIRTHACTHTWSVKTVPARKGANARTIMAHAQAKAIPDGNGGIPQGIWCAWVWQFKADCCASRVGVIRATLCWSRRGGQRVLGQRYASHPPP